MTSSCQVLRPSYSFLFEERSGQACLAYVDTGSAWVAAGPPFGEEEAVRSLARYFLREARRVGRRACFFGVEGEFSRGLGLESLAIGEEPHWELHDWPEQARAHRSFREQLRRASKKGVQTRVVEPAQLIESCELRGRMRRLLEVWQRRRALPPFEFLIEVELFDPRCPRFCVLAEREGELLAFALFSGIPAEKRILLENLVRGVTPHGTSELLIDAGFRFARENGARSASLGLAPLSGPLEWPLTWIQRWGNELYAFKGLRAFKERLRPSHWERWQLAFPPPQSKLTAVSDVARAFVGRDASQFSRALWPSLSGSLRESAGVQLCIKALSVASLSSKVF